ncbi:sodium metabolite cotransporter, chloroplastic-like [Raphidocelis subcapitata]|uniref:Sodium metabolite cotransporter, chloroplastic-like n=1 Tax=Raphidocelis subcapitata TaxID=307507 RepID=A0A2V0PCG8_9CHLO|nr:sodium metabolite cotransporter, chloroplastic-like [Raphidocelis subcapitata]|eukprot:GBF95580.1 sodium metabolite cotransporter, chloroplastic-like [Raphidocelis subcapitata]
MAAAPACLRLPRPEGWGARSQSGPPAPRIPYFASAVRRRHAGVGKAAAAGCGDDGAAPAAEAASPLWPSQRGGPCQHQRLQPLARPSQCRAPHARRAVACRGSAAASTGGGGGDGAAAAPDGPLRRAAAAAAAFVQAQFLPVALLTAIAVGVAFPAPGVAVGQLPGVNAFVTTAMFVISGLQLKQGEAARALQARGAVAFGLASILLITPLFSRAALALPLQPAELGVGLAVFCCMPTALSSGITLTQAVGGNAALALLLTVASNMLGVFTLPFLLPWLLGPGLAGGGGGLDPLVLLAKLLRTVLLPAVVGAAARAFVPGVADWVDARRRNLAYGSAVLLAIVPWTQVSATVAGGAGVGGGALALALAGGVAVHLAFLALNSAACAAFRFGGPDGAEARGLRRALILTASVKTLPVAVAVLASLGPAIGPAAGLAVVPCMLAHLSQIVIDSALVARWKAQDAAAAAGKAA